VSFDPDTYIYIYIYILRKICGDQLTRMLL
jgi:hypothetical protein